MLFLRGDGRGSMKIVSDKKNAERIAALLAALPAFKSFLDDENRWSLASGGAPVLHGLNLVETLELLMMHAYYYGAPDEEDDPRRRYLELWEKHARAGQMARTLPDRRLH